MAVAPIILWWTWKDDSDQILVGSSPILANAKRQPKHSCEYQKLYSAILSLCAGAHILASQSISMAQAWIGQDLYCCLLLQLNVPLIINHHLSMHYIKFIMISFLGQYIIGGYFPLSTSMECLRKSSIMVMMVAEWN